MERVGQWAELEAVRPEELVEAVLGLVPMQQGVWPINNKIINAP